MSGFLPDGFWRDLLSLSWDHRTLHTIPTIKAFLEEDRRFVSSGLKLLGLDGSPKIFAASEGATGHELLPDVLLNAIADFTWIEGFFDFETKLAKGRGFFRIMPGEDGAWKAK